MSATTGMFIFIHYHLQVIKQFRDYLNLINNSAINHLF